MTPEQRTKIDAAMDKFSGQAVHAAAVLGMSLKDLQKAIRGDKELTRKWVEQKVLTPAEVLSRSLMSPPQVAPSMEARLATKMAADDAIFRQGMDKVGFKGEQLDLLLSVQALAGKTFRNTVEFFHGGMTYNAANCLMEKQQLAKLQNGIIEALDLSDEGNEKFPLGSEGRSLVVDELKALGTLLRDCDAVMMKCAEIANRGMLTVALMKQRDRAKLAPKTDI